jgi:hypothetical protein
MIFNSGDILAMEKGMMRTTKILLLAVSIFSLPLEAALPVVEAAQTGFDPRIIALGEARDEIKSKPIEQRPYRPLHVYGNTVRRRHTRAHSSPRMSGQR